KRRQSPIRVPEIALTAQFLDRFAQRFGTRPAEWHSELGARKRARTWAAVAAGEVNVVVSAERAPTTTFTSPAATAAQVRARLRAPSSECHSAGRVPKRCAKRSRNCAVSAISGTRIGDWRRL